jgi:hypothetical protein
MSGAAHAGWLLAPVSLYKFIVDHSRMHSSIPAAKNIPVELKSIR